MRKRFNRVDVWLLYVGVEVWKLFRDRGDPQLEGVMVRVRWINLDSLSWNLNILGTSNSRFIFWNWKTLICKKRFEPRQNLVKCILFFSGKTS